MATNPGQMLSHYRLVEKIGEGGMGVVWKAEDTVLNRTVAIKVLPANVVQDKERREMFLKEARLASSVSDAHIVQVHEFSRDDDLDFIVMEYVEGNPLKNLLHGRPLPPHKVADFGHQIAKALSRAHRKQLLHRDLKPGNVLVTPDGEVKVVDFGLAVLFRDRQQSIGPSATTQSASADAVTQAEGGRIAGTIPYMSPEQVRAERLDARSDIFSLGVVLYEMTTGQRPFAAASRAELVHEIQQARPQPPHQLVSKLPLELERIIEKALAARRANRYQSMEDLAVDLKRLDRALESGSAPSFGDIPPQPKALRWLPASLVGLAAVLVTVAAVWILWPGVGEGTQGTKPVASWDVGAPAPDSAPPLPEQGSAAREYYQKGMEYYLNEEETLRNLASAIQMFHRALEVEHNFALGWATIGEAYWVRYQETREASSRDEAIRAVDEAFRLHPGLAEAHLAKGFGLFVEEDLHAAKEELHKAVKGRPNLDRAWVILGRACLGLGEYAAGRDALQKAIGLRPDEFRYHIWLGLFFEDFSEYDAAVSAYERARDLRPNNTMTWNNLAAALLHTYRLEEARSALIRSLEIEETATARDLLGTVSYFLDDHDKAAENYRRATVLEPDRATHWANLGDALKVLGNEDESRTAYLEAVDLAREKTTETPRDPVARMRLGLYCARAGNQECAIGEGRLAEAMQPRNAEILFRVAIIFYLAGREDDALDFLERAVRLGLSKVEIENDPDLTTLHEHPRYQRILELAS